MYSSLVLGTGTQGLAMIKALKAADCRVVLLYGDKNNYADLSRYIDKKYQFLGDTVSNDYLKEILSIIEKEHIDVIIPMGDNSAEFLSCHKEELRSKARFDTPDFEHFKLGDDKNKLMFLCQQKGYPHPKTIDISEFNIDAEELKSVPYPAMLKPNCTTGGRGMTKVNDYSQLRGNYPELHKQYGDYHLQQFIKPGGRQVKVQLYVNRDKNLVASSVIEKRRWYPVQGGSNCCAVTIKDDSLVDMCYHILLDIDWLGFADFDLIEDPETHKLLVMEINPRVPACIKSPIAAGLNWGQVFVDSCMGISKQVYNYKEGVVLRHLGFDFLWFLKSPNRWKSKPNWFNFFGKNVYYQDMSSWTDPLPFFGGTWNNIKKLITGHRK